MSDSTNDYSKNEDKLEDILSSIRGIIDNSSPLSEERQTHEDKKNDESILELTDVIDPFDYNADALISSSVQEKSETEFKRFVKSVKNVERTESKIDSLDDRVNQIMRPLIKNWLNNNLPKIVERVVSEEIKRIIPKT